MGWPVISAMRSKSLSRCSTVSPASSAVAATIRSGIEGARCWPRSASNARTSAARSSMAGVRYSTGIQDELTRRAAEQGFDDLRARHGAVLAYLDPDGIRLADLARLSQRNKQTVAAIVDELENLGYLYRADDPADRRAKLIVPTERGRHRMRAGDQIIADIEQRHEAELGRTGYARFKQALHTITTDEAKEEPPEEQAGQSR